MKSREQLLVIEDSPEDFDIITRALRRGGFVGELRQCVNGDEALALLLGMKAVTGQGRSSYPRLVILDLNLPGTDGRAVLEEIKSHPGLKTTPVVVFSTSADPSDIEHCYRLGANSYIRKPVDPDEFTHAIELLVRYWFDAVTPPDEASRARTHR